jgi:site-specific recombinase XerD
LYRNDYVKYNPIEKVDPPKPTKKILPSLSPEQVTYLIEQAENIQAEAIMLVGLT